MAVTFGSVLDEVLEHCHAVTGYRMVGETPDDGKPYALLVLIGGRQNTRVTAEIDLLVEVWEPRESATAYVTAERKAERVRAVIESLEGTHSESGFTFYRTDFPSFPAHLPPGDAIERERWARVTFRTAITTRGNQFVP